MELENKDKLVHYSEGPRDLVTKKPKEDIRYRYTGHLPAMFANYEVVEVLNTISEGPMDKQCDLPLYWEPGKHTNMAFVRIVETTTIP